MTGSAVTLAWGATSHRGALRARNEDMFMVSDAAFFVADGMGGHESGEVASAVAVEALSPLSQRPVVTPEEIQECLEQAQKRLREISSDDRRSPGTTVTGVALARRDDRPYWLIVNLGDSRAYRLASGVLEQISTDHSEVQELVDAGVLSATDAATYPRRNVVTRALGAWRAIEPDFWYVPIESGDRMMLCSDGLTGELTDEVIADILSSWEDPQEAADCLVSRAIAAGGRDNITVVVVEATRVLLTAIGQPTSSTSTATEEGHETTTDTPNGWLR